MINFSIASFTNNTGIAPTAQSYVASVFGYLSNYFSKVINGNATIDIQVSIDSAMPAGAIATAGSQITWQIDGSGKIYNVQNVSTAKIISGTDFNGGSPDAVLAINSTEIQRAMTQNPDPSHTDLSTNTFASTLEHELTHVLGFTGLLDPTSAQPSAPGKETTFDQHVSVDHNGPAFTGTYSTLIYGGSVPLAGLGYASSIYHTSEAAGSPTFNDLMNPSRKPTSKPELSDTDLAMLKDLGYDINKSMTSVDGHTTVVQGHYNQSISGTQGNDQAFFTGNRGDYSLTRVGTNVVATENAGNHSAFTLSSVEELKFGDMSISTTIAAKAASIAPSDLSTLEELYVAFFNRVPDADGLGYWIDQVKGGMSFRGIADSFYTNGIAASDQTGYKPNMTNSDFIKIVYENALSREPDPAGLLYWLGDLNAGTQSRGSLVNAIVVGAHAYKGDPTYGWVADLLDNKLAVANTFAIQDGITYNTNADSITKGMAIAASITSTDTSAAIALIGIHDQGWITNPAAHA